MAEATESLPDDIRRELQEAAMGGIAKLKDVIMDRNSVWKKIPINIAITGESGVGKSTFINGIRGITADDKDGAHADSVEATKVMKSYEHPSNGNMILWDLPGVGTPNFPQDTYLEKVKFERFDFFLILSAGRFRDADKLLAKEIRNLKKNFLFVRTQIGLEIIKDRQAHPTKHDKSKLLEKIRDDCRKNLADYGFEGSSVFLIDSYDRLEFDFDALATRLIDEAPEHKKEAMTLSMTLLTTGVLHKKVEVLSKRIMSSSIISAIGGLMPIPLFGSFLME